MFNKKILLTSLVLLGALVALPATSMAQLTAPVTLNMIVPASVSVVADCDGGGGTTATLTFVVATKLGTGSCTNVTVSWVQAVGQTVQLEAALTTPMTDGTTSIPAANHFVKISGNTFGDTAAVTTFTTLSAAVNVFQELIAPGEQNRNDTFSVDFQVDTSTVLALSPNTYTGTVTLTVSAF